MIHIFLPKLISLLLLLVITGILSMGGQAISQDSKPESHETLLTNLILLFFDKDSGGSSSGNSYRGHEGFLMMDPITARALGLKTIVTEDYVRGKELFREAQKALTLGIEAMNAAGVDEVSEQLLQLVADYSCEYNRHTDESAGLMQEYRKALEHENDERFDKDASKNLTDKLIKLCIESAGGNLRDSLACFYNKTRGIEETGFQLNTANVAFVNRVYRGYIETIEKTGASPVFNLDRHEGASEVEDRWKRVKSRMDIPYKQYLDDVFRENLKTGIVVDPLLFAALMRQESNFNSLAVSYVGAAGLTQIMPSTGKSLGMKNIYMTSYYEEARDFFVKEMELKKGAVSLFKGICRNGKRGSASQAVDKMVKSNISKKNRTELYSRYKAEISGGAKDDRLDPAKAIRYGYAYFAEILRQQKGDISLALAGYNSGPHRVKQFGGLPPYQETVSFRNNVLRFYKEYLKVAAVRQAN